MHIKLHKIIYRTMVFEFDRFATREAFMRNVMSQQNFTHYTYVLDLIKESEKLYEKIQKMERYIFETLISNLALASVKSPLEISLFFVSFSVMPLHDEERLFLEAIRDLNHQVGKLQEEEREDVSDGTAKPSVVPNPSTEELDIKKTTTVVAAEEASSTSDCRERAAQTPTKVDTGELVNAAVAYAIEAAMKLNSNGNSALNPSPTSLHSVVSWANEPSSTAPIKKAAAIIASDSSCLPSLADLKGYGIFAEKVQLITEEVDEIYETQQDLNFISSRKRPLSALL